MPRRARPWSGTARASAGEAPAHSGESSAVCPAPSGDWQELACFSHVPPVGQRETAAHRCVETYGRDVVAGVAMRRRRLLVPAARVVGEWGAGRRPAPYRSNRFGPGAAMAADALIAPSWRARLAGQATRRRPLATGSLFSPRVESALLRGARVCRAQAQGFGGESPTAHFAPITSSADPDPSAASSSGPLFGKAHPHRVSIAGPRGHASARRRAPLRPRVPH